MEVSHGAVRPLPPPPSDATGLKFNSLAIEKEESTLRDAVCVGG